MGDHPGKPGSHGGVVVPMDRVPVPCGCGISDQAGSRDAHLAVARAPIVLRRRLCPLGDVSWIGDVRDQEQRGGVGHRADVVDDLDIEVDKCHPTTFSNPAHLAGYIHLGLDADPPMPGEGLLAMYHRPVGQLAEQVGSHDKQECGHEARRRSVLPPVGIVTGCPYEIVDVLDTYPEVMGADGLVDEVGRVQVFHGNGDGVCTATGLGLGERDWRSMRRSLRRLVVLASIFALLGATVPVASAAPAACENRNNNTIAKLLECVDVEGVRDHQAAFQAIADANGGTRAAGTPGYEASVDYVVERMEAAGYTVTLDEFPFTFFPPPTLQQTAPITATYETGVFTGSGFGTVAGNVIPVDLNLTPPHDPVTSGCEASDFTGFGGSADIALIQRGTCTFAEKAVNAQTAGAEAVIIFNQGNTPQREALIVGTAAFLPNGDPSNLTIPVVGASFADGAALAQAGSTALVDVDPPIQTTQVNVLAEKTGKNDSNVVMAGAHLDSVQAGPGINDNGSGSAALLEVAEQMAKVKPQNTLRFAWWGAEESGLVGSTAYVAGLAQAELDEIAAYLNFDMVGSPNHVFFIYDGDNSDGVGAPAGPMGSAQIEDKFEEFFASRDIATLGTDFDGRSDYGPFIATGIPAGGLFTGAEGIKTAAQAAEPDWGGTAGQQYDPCYHLVCDTFGNVNLFALDTNSDAIAYATLSFAMSTELINGEKSKGNFRPEEQAPAA